MMSGRAVASVGSALGMFAALPACDRQTVDAAAQPYEIVTQMRPESLEAYMKVFRLAYDMCARVRAIQHLPPPPPLVALPADFVTKRSTYLSSGSGHLIRHEEFNVVMEEAGCKTRLDSVITEAVVRGGEVYGQRREMGGDTEVIPPAPSGWDPSKAASDEASYAEKRTVGGIGMRCLSAYLRGGITLDKCAANTNAGLLRDGAGDPIVLYAYELVPGRDKMVVLTEPVSVQIGKPVSPERIALSGVK
ncbi:hypothetical protein [Massilia sp.]|uniref:hypothetical protein n=1 Tax=Massilia sp. TaxID=1882437 RepID=UPI002899E6FB|nr:hypothetical protein [Massilia sp.]